MKKQICCLFLLSSKVLFAQSTLQENRGRAQTYFSVFAAARMQSTPMNFFNFKQVRYDPFIPYNDEANIQQPSLGLRIAAQIEKISISYAPFIHYGPLHHYTPNPPVGTGQGYIPEEQKRLLFDQEVRVAYHLPVKKKMNPASFGVGVGILNTGKNIFLVNGPYNQVLDLQIRHISGQVGFEPFGKRLPIDLGFHYLYNGTPSNRVDRMLFYSLTVNYRVVQKVFIL